jgi:hypothetical protein
MHPLTNYQLGKFRHEEIQAEFERYWRYQSSNPGEPSWPPKYRRIVGWGSLVLGTLMIVQKIIG